MTGALPRPLDTSPCFSCAGAHCCFEFRVAITPADVQRLVRATGRSPLELAVLFPKRGTDGIRMGADDVEYELCLGKRAFDDGRNGCVLLAGAPGALRCAVHPARPMVCRSFPLHRVDGAWRADGLAPCPTGLWGRGHVHHDASEALHGLWAIERALSAAFVRRWNEIAELAPPGRSRSPGMFFYWVLAVFDRVEAALAPELASPARLAALLADFAGGGLDAVAARGALTDALALLDDVLAEARRRGSSPV